MKKKHFIIAALILPLIFTAGCSTLFSRNAGVIGKSSKAEEKAMVKIETIDSTTAKINVDRLGTVGAFAEGVSYALSKDTNTSPAVVTANELNERIIALGNKPDFKEAQSIAFMVDELITNKVQGEKILSEKDKEIESFGIAIKDLESEKDTALKDYYDLANKIASESDQYKATLNDMNKWAGLGAIWYGVKHFIVRMSWILGIGSILFLILRLAAMSNPIAASIFSIFDVIASWFVNAIKVIAPKALNLAGHVTTSAYNNVKGVLTTVVDSVETVRMQSAASGKPATIQDLLNTAEVSMTPSDKQLIDKIKIELGWVTPTVVSTVVPLVLPTTGSLTPSDNQVTGSVAR